MVLSDILVKEKKSIVDEWKQAIFETYPSETVNFLQKQSNQFSNPVGYSITQGIEVIYDSLSGDVDSQKIDTAIDQIVRIRSIQEFQPGHAVGCFILLKDILWEKFDKSDLTKHIDSFRAIESKIDAMTLKAFDIYVECHKKLFEIKANELKRSYSRLLDRTQFFEKLEHKSESPKESQE